MPGLGTGGNGIPPYDLEGKAAAWLPHSKDAVRREGKAAAWLPHSKDTVRRGGQGGSMAAALQGRGASGRRGHESNH